MRLTAKTLTDGLSSTSAALLSAGIIFIGLRFQYAPAEAARGFGVANPPGADEPFLAVKGVRDIMSGLIVLALLANGQRRALGWALLASAFSPLGDTAIVLRSGGKPQIAFGVHGLTAAWVVATGIALIRQERARA